ncbi:hypothetical protein RBU61_05510 [Tissierella sp. MB52-C2]|uniref:hypothetical protein n=1 Tax=Tissierella sp. MB52-C2 TaxID=3070999 RepID=UPI00280B9D97|nr:hypothetical protein [Tissierella sp. MB52-C2]WMM26132.1 hypothetical protein RBU61_05510 [Tissierella sp. MB52-C2]
MGTFKTDKSQYFYDTGTSKMFSCDIDEYEILKNLTEIGDLSQLEQTVSGKEKKLALKKIEQYIKSEKNFKRSGIMFKIKKVLPVF